MALAYFKELDPHTSFALWKIDEKEDELIAQLQLKDHEKKYLDSLNKGKRNLHWLSTRVLLRKMLNTSSYIDCKTDEHGKPYLSNLPYFISLSHSFEYAAVMISENKPVGIDIELVDTKIERIAHKFMNEQELSSMDSTHLIEHLYISWCAKEAIYKLQGKRNVSFLNHIRLRQFKYSSEGSLNASLNIGLNHREFEVHYQKLDGYMIGYVADGNYAK
ncbi:MAG: 4'-phosphopantetheinyl transferase superfamily protein [Flavobacterium sp.]|nr:4'-phosphopantetheinyl transferase superfamily protein [Pedobacter sp.]